MLMPTRPRLQFLAWLGPVQEEPEEAHEGEGHEEGTSSVAKSHMRCASSGPRMVSMRTLCGRQAAVLNRSAVRGPRTMSMRTFP
eukprot:5544702-Lingulodinium_polyedra.AAC.1